MNGALILKDGTVLYGKGFGARTERIGELVFNTSMIGYQEALTDPSYAGQILLMTYPLIGNYGIDSKNNESSSVHVEGFAVHNMCEHEDHRDSIKTVDSFLKESNVPGIHGIDTRFIVRHVRSQGVMPAILATYEGNCNTNELMKRLSFDYSSVDFVSKVTTKKPEIYGNENKTTVVLIDYGVKMNIVRELVQRKLKVVVVPSWYTAKQIKEYEPQGILLSNGPGDPAILTEAHKTIRELSDLPLFGICLGHQLITHAFGGNTYKLKFGHRGGNHPVLDKVRNKVVITTQNHGFATQNVPKDFEVTHLNLNDSTIEGIRHTSKPIFSVQYHPESSPGPEDSKYLFDQFVKNILKR